MADSELQVKITADSSGLQAGIEQAASGVSQLEQAYQALNSSALNAERMQRELADAMAGVGQKAEETGSKIEEAFSRIGEITTSLFLWRSAEEGLESLKDFFEEATFGGMEWGESIKNASISTGIGVQQLQSLQYAAQVAGVSTDRLQMVVNRLSMAMLQLRTTGGSPEMQKALQLLDIDPGTFTDAYDALSKIGEKVREIGQLSLEQRGALEQFLGGRAGMTLLPVIMHLKEFQEEARKAGIIVGEEGVEKLDAGAEAVNRMDAAWQRLQRTIAGVASGPLTPLLERLATFFTTGGIDTNRLTAALENLQAGRYTARDTAVIRGASAEELGRAGGLAAGNAGPTESPGEEQITAGFEKAPKKVKESAAAARKAWSDVWDDGTFGKKETAAIDRQLAEMVRSYDESARKSAAAVKKWDAEAERGRIETIKRAIKDYDAYEKQVEKDNEEMQRQFAHLFDPLMQAFETTIQGVILGTEKIGKAFSRLGVSIGLELGKNMLESAIGGAAKSSPLSAIFGVSGQGGGVAGLIGPEVMKLLPQVTQLFKTVFSSGDLLSSVTGLFGGAFGGLSSILGGAGSGIMSLFSALPALLAFEGGGVVSAAGGMAVGDRGVLSILHPREMVLPANLSERVMNMTEPGGGGAPIIQIHAVDAKSFIDRLHEYKDHITDAVVAAHRDGHQGLNNALGRVHAR